MTKTYLEQYYVFPGPDGWAWCEMFFGTTHVTAPTPCRSVPEAISLLMNLHPHTIVDELLPEDIGQAMSYAWAEVRTVTR